MSGAWSNDQLNSIIVYSPTTGHVILQVDQTGLYFTNTDDGGYFKVVTGNPDDNNGVSVELQPPDSAVAGVTYTSPGAIYGAETATGNPGEVQGITTILSPSLNGGQSSAIFLDSTTNLGQPTEIQFLADGLFGPQINEIGQGNVDEGGTPSYTSNNFTGTEIAADYISEIYGTFSGSRRYEGRWSGTVQSSTSGDTVGLRLYTGPNKTSLTGATQISDYGRITCPSSNQPVPFFVSAGFNGIPGKFLLLGARRTSGSGTCFVTINYRRCEDTVAAY